MARRGSLLYFVSIFYSYVFCMSAGLITWWWYELKVCTVVYCLIFFCCVCQSFSFISYVLYSLCSFWCCLCKRNWGTSRLAVKSSMMSRYESLLSALQKKSIYLFITRIYLYFFILSHLLSLNDRNRKWTAPDQGLWPRLSSSGCWIAFPFRLVGLWLSQFLLLVFWFRL